MLQYYVEYYTHGINTHESKVRSSLPLLPKYRCGLIFVDPPIPTSFMSQAIDVGHDLFPNLFVIVSFFVLVFYVFVCVQFQVDGSYQELVTSYIFCNTCSQIMPSPYHPYVTKFPKLFCFATTRCGWITCWRVKTSHKKPMIFLLK